MCKRCRCTEGVQVFSCRTGRKTWEKVSTILVMEVDQLTNNNYVHTTHTHTHMPLHISQQYTCTHTYAHMCTSYITELAEFLVQECGSKLICLTTGAEGCILATSDMVNPLLKLVISYELSSCSWWRCLPPKYQLSWIPQGLETPSWEG